MTNTPYDDVFRTLLNDCSTLIFPLLNETFGECYTGQEKIIFAPNEHFLNRQNGEMNERITDTCFRIEGNVSRKYHWECQSSTDSSMLVRFFEYDTQIALDEGVATGNVFTVIFPHSAVLYLRCNASTPSELKTRIVTPGGTVEYAILVMHSQKYSVEEIFRKKLLFLIPFHIFSYENMFERYEQDRRLLDMLKREYEYIKNRLEELQEKKEIDEYTKCTIIDMSKKVLDHIAKKYDNIREEVKSVMGGKVLEYEAKTIKNEGKREGRREGRLEVLIDLACDGLLTIKEAALRADITEDTFQKKMQEHRRI